MDAEQRLAEAIDECKRLGQEYAALTDRQHAEIVELRGRVANLRRLRELDAQIWALRQPPPPKLGVWDALRLWARSWGVKDDETEEDCYDLRN